MLSANIHVSLVLCLFTSLKITAATVYLRNPNERGPTAVNSGTKCICTMSQNYFNNLTITRTKNLEFFHSNNLSAPSADIGSNFLMNIHAMIMAEVIEGLQIRVTSDARGIHSLVNVDPESIMPVDYYVFVIDEITKFKENMEKIVTKSPSWNPGARFLLLFNNPDLRIDANGYSGIDIASKFFNLLYNRFNVIRAVVLYASGIKTYNVYVTDPFKNDQDCRSLKPILIDECDTGVLKNSELTTTSIRASRMADTAPACTFTFCAKESEPYVDDNCTSGLEMDVVKIIQDIMKFQTKIVCSTMPRGDLHNGSWTGLLRLIRTDKCDFIFGGFFPDNEVHEDFGVTTSYFQDTYTWYIYLAPLRPRWKGLIEIFQSETWLLLITTLFIAGISWFVFGFVMAETSPHKKFELCVMNSLAVILGISSNNRPNHTPLRVFFILLALYGLNVTTIYTSKLITVFTEPAHEQQMVEIREIMDAGVPIGIVCNALHWIDNLTFYKFRLVYERTWCDSVFKKCLKVKRSKCLVEHCSFVKGGQEEYSDWFMNDNPVDQMISQKYNTSDRFQPTLENMAMDDIFGIPGNVFSNPLEMIAERGFPLIKKFSNLINRMKDAGLTSKIYKDFLYNKTILDFISHRDRIHEIGQITLTLDHLEGAFAVLIIGLLVSFVVLLVEILLKSKRFIVNCGQLKSKVNKQCSRLKIKPKRKVSKPRRLKIKPRKKKSVRLPKKFR